MVKDKSKHINKYIILGNNIRKYRKSLGLSQEELAFRINSARNYIGCIERAEKYPSIAVIFDIADVLDISAEKLFANTQF